MAEEITITISPKAEVTVSVDGHKGSGCQELTKMIEKSLGKTTSDTKTKEYNESGTAHQNISQR